MNIHPSRLESLQEFIIGGLMPYLTGRDLVNLFNSIGFEDVYNFEKSRLPGNYMGNLNVSRKTFVLRKLREVLKIHFLIIFL
jgi:hypothetical protein